MSFTANEKKEWGAGPWIEEPDHLEWKDQARGEYRNVAYVKEQVAHLAKQLKAAETKGAPENDQ